MKYMMLTNNELNEFISSFPYNLNLEKNLKVISYHLEIKYDNQILYHIKHIQSIPTLEFESSINPMLNDILDKSGLYDLDIQYYKSNNTSIKTEEPYYIFNNIIFRKNIYTFNDYKNWFSKLFRCFNNKQIYLIPDSNVIIRKYYSNYLKDIINNNSNVSFVLSDLVKKEIEAKSNRSKEKISKLKKELEEDSNTQKKLGYEIEIKKLRLSSDMFAETSKIKDDGAIINNADSSLIDSFSNASPDDKDYWIRKEVKEYIQKKRNSIIIFLTCDYANAASSETDNINTIYFHRHQVDHEIKSFEKIPLLIYNTIVSFGKCDMKIYTCDNYVKEYKLFGEWNGKSFDDWKNNRIIMKNL